MADLKLEIAQSLAAALMNIGHPYQQSALNATALNLIKWCRGNIALGLSPEQQATALVEEAAETWTAGWPERGGTAALFALFKAKYVPKPKEQSEDEMLSSMIRRGLLTAPCPLCKAEYAKWCEHGGYERHARAKEREAAEKVIIDVATGTAPPSPPERINPPVDVEAFLRNAKRAHEDEQLRKRRQIEELEKAGVL
jgi:hypothetical protein